jgi:hypothetical protein
MVDRIVAGPMLRDEMLLPVRRVRESLRPKCIIRRNSIGGISEEELNRFSIGFHFG